MTKREHLMLRIVRFSYVHIAFFLNILCGHCALLAAEEYRAQPVLSGLNAPWAIEFLDDDRALVTEKSGRLQLLSLSKQSKTELTGVAEVWYSGQGGLLDVALAPDFQASRELFFTYSKAVDGGVTTALAKAFWPKNSSQLQRWQDLLVAQATQEGGQHFGSRITFDSAGHVLFGIGDRGEREEAQNLLSHAGAILRLNRDGSIPADNPFVKEPNALPEIWTVGHRNPQGLFFDLRSQQLWSIEHGPRGGDEINLIERGRNYGWPIISYGQEYYAPIDVGEKQKVGMEQPIKYYVPSIAPSSLIRYSGKAIPQWKGNLLSGALRGKHLNRVEVNAENRAVGEARLFEALGERIRDIAETPNGKLFFITDSGQLYSIAK
jgi:glucose/arabinose dehydrogenase